MGNINKKIDHTDATKNNPDFRTVKEVANRDQLFSCRTGARGAFPGGLPGKCTSEGHRSVLGLVHVQPHVWRHQTG